MKEKKPITEYEEIYGLGDMVSGVPLCPHCGEWSYYTTKEAEENGGYTECPFCGGLMYMPDWNNYTSHRQSAIYVKEDECGSIIKKSRKIIRLYMDLQNGKQRT